MAKPTVLSVGTQKMWVNYYGQTITGTITNIEIVVWSSSEQITIEYKTDNGYVAETTPQGWLNIGQ